MNLVARIGRWLCERGFHKKRHLPNSVNMSGCFRCGIAMKTDNALPCSYQSSWKTFRPGNPITAFSGETVRPVFVKGEMVGATVTRDNE